MGGKWRVRYLFARWMETFDKRGKKETIKEGGKRKRYHEIKKNEWLYLSVIKTVPKNKQTRGNKPRARL